MIKEYFLLVFIVYSYGVEKVQLDFFQDDYDIVLHIAEYSWYNKSLVRNAKCGLVLYNRTQRVFNGTFELLIDLGSDIILDVQMYKMMSNEYRFFPITFKANACEEYMGNSFGIKDVLTKTSNFGLCNVKKGAYYIRNATSDSSKFPPHMPRGSYKTVSKFVYHSAVTMQLDFYFRLIDKPIDWKNIPKFKKHNK